MGTGRGEMREGFLEEEGSESNQKDGVKGCGNGSESGRPLKEMGIG